MNNSLMEVMARLRGHSNTDDYNFLDYISKKYFEDNAMGITAQKALDFLDASDRERLISILSEMAISIS